MKKKILEWGSNPRKSWKYRELAWQYNIYDRKLKYLDFNTVYSLIMRDNVRSPICVVFNYKEIPTLVGENANKA